MSTGSFDLKSCRETAHKRTIDLKLRQLKIEVPFLKVGDGILS